MTTKPDSLATTITATLTVVAVTLTIMAVTLTIILTIGLTMFATQSSEYEKCMDVPVTSDHTVEYYMNIADECERLYQ